MTEAQELLDKANAIIDADPIMILCRNVYCDECKTHVIADAVKIGKVYHFHATCHDLKYSIRETDDGHMRVSNDCDKRVAIQYPKDDDAASQTQP